MSEENAEGDTSDGPTDGADGADDAQNGGDQTVPRVDLSLYELSVSVSGRSDDELDDVEESARRLMDYLVSHSEDLEDEPDQYGLS